MDSMLSCMHNHTCTYRVYIILWKSDVHTTVLVCGII